MAFCDTLDNETETLSVGKSPKPLRKTPAPTDNVSESLSDVSQNPITGHSDVILHPSHNNAKIPVDHVEPSADVLTIIVYTSTHVMQWMARY
jgi:hypothetical protein